MNFFLATKTRLFISTLALLFGIGVLVLMWSIEPQEDEPLELESNFPLHDYLFQNTPLAPNAAKKSNAFFEVRQKLQEAKEKIQNLQKQLENPRQKEVIVLAQKEKAKEKPPTPIPSALNTHLANQRFVYHKASPTQQRQLRELAQRIEGFIPQQGPNKMTEIEYGVDSFSNFNKQNTGSNEHKLLRTITADKLIPAILIRPISSQLYGETIAQVETNIYGAMGRAVLIPKGSKILGIYNNNNKVGEYRLQIFWTRILTPQGINILLTEAKGADVKGYSGLIGQTYQRNWERYGLPLSLTTLSNGLLLTLQARMQTGKNPPRGFFKDYATAQLLNQAQGDISNVIGQILREQIKINPLIIIKEGSRVFIALKQDIFIPKPKKGETLARFFTEIKQEGGEEETQDTDIYFEK